MIEVFARIKEPELSEQAIAYTRKVTMVWVCFFLINGSISLYTLELSREVWVLYNGLISYVLMALIFAIEWVVRQRVKGKTHA